MCGAADDMRGDGVPPPEGPHLPPSLQGHHAEDAVPRRLPGFSHTRRLLRVTGEDLIEFCIIIISRQDVHC